MAINSDIISVIYLLSFLFYGLIEYPFTPKTYWQILTVYCVTIIFLKFIY